MTEPDQSAADPGDAAADPVSKPETKHGRAGRNLTGAVVVGLIIGGAAVASLIAWRPGFVILMAAALVLGAIEMHGALMKVRARAAIVPITLGTLAIVIGTYIAGSQDVPLLPSHVFLLASLGLTVVVALVWRMIGGQIHYVRDCAASLLIIGYVPLLGAFASLLLASERGNTRMVVFICTVVLTDTGGYLVGVLLGRHPMAPRISPKKTWEGLVGSFVFATLGCTVLMSLVFGSPWWAGAILGFAIAGAAVCGDLVESMIKRDIGIKDMSSVLPGHGGMMDRLDSLLFAAPVAWLLMYLLIPVAK